MLSTKTRAPSQEPYVFPEGLFTPPSSLRSVLSGRVDTTGTSTEHNTQTYAHLTFSTPERSLRQSCSFEAPESLLPRSTSQWEENDLPSVAQDETYLSRGKERISAAALGGNSPPHTYVNHYNVKVDPDLEPPNFPEFGSEELVYDAGRDRYIFCPIGGTDLSQLEGPSKGGLVQNFGNYPVSEVPFSEEIFPQQNCEFANNFEVGVAEWKDEEFAFNGELDLALLEPPTLAELGIPALLQYCHESALPLPTIPVEEDVFRSSTSTALEDPAPDAQRFGSTDLSDQLFQFRFHLLPLLGTPQSPSPTFSQFNQGQLGSPSHVVLDDYPEASCKLGKRRLEYFHDEDLPPVKRLFHEELSPDLRQVEFPATSGLSLPSGGLDDAYFQNLPAAPSNFLGASGTFSDVTNSVQPASTSAAALVTLEKGPPKGEIFLGNEFICAWKTCKENLSLAHYQSDAAFRIDVWDHISSHVGLKSPKRRWLCQWLGCSAILADRRSLIRHIHTHQTNKAGIPCPHCGRMFTRSDVRTNHLNSCARKRQEKKNGN